MAKITYKEVNVLQHFHTYYREVYTRIYDELKDADENILVSYMTDVDDPTKVEFIVGARNIALLHNFILSHQYTISQLSPEAERLVKEFYSKQVEF